MKNLLNLGKSLSINEQKQIHGGNSHHCHNRPDPCLIGGQCTDDSDCLLGLGLDYMFIEISCSNGYCIRVD